jgi:DNA-binding TFAR19-related protein (PDSD5 family)
MDELEEIRKRKIEELQHQHITNLQSQIQEQQQIQQQLEQIESVVKQKLTRDALIRFGNYKTAFPEQAAQLSVILYQLIAKKSISRIDDDSLKEILRELQPKKHEIKIIKK